MRPNADPRAIAIHPALEGVICLLCAVLWVFAFKLLAVACVATAGMVGAGQ